MMRSTAGQVASGNGFGGASGSNPGTGALPNSSDDSASHGSGGCAVDAGADSSGATGALILAMFIMTLGTSRQRRR